MLAFIMAPQRSHVMHVCTISELQPCLGSEAQGAAHCDGRSVARNRPESISGSSTAYGPPSASCSSRNCVSGGRSRAQLPHSGVILRAARHTEPTLRQLRRMHGKPRVAQGPHQYIFILALAKNLATHKHTAASARRAPLEWEGKGQG